MFKIMQLILFLPNHIECDKKNGIEIFLSRDLYSHLIYLFVYVTQFFHFQKKLLLFNVFKFVTFSFVITGNINK